MRFLLVVREVRAALQDGPAMYANECHTVYMTKWISRKSFIRKGTVLPVIWYVWTKSWNIPEGPYQEKLKPFIRVPEGSYYAAVEGSRGEFGVFLESQGDKTPYRLHYRSTGLPLVAAIDTICRGAKIADLIAIGGTIDYVVPDIDR